MDNTGNIRPDPDELLASIKRDEEQSKKGKLKIFFGMCAGVGKTFSMLESALIDKTKGTDIVIGYVETHNRRDTNELLKGFEMVPRKKINYKGSVLEDADIETIILLIDKYGKSIIKLPNIQNILNGFEKRLSTISDIDFPFEEILAKIEILKDLSLRGWGTRAEKILSSLHDQILDIINTESLEFMHSVNLWPIPKNYLP